jgi:hypothetical protein
VADFRLKAGVMVAENDRGNLTVLENKEDNMFAVISPAAIRPYSPAEPRLEAPCDSVVPEDDATPPLKALFPADLRQSPPHGGQLLALRLSLGQFLAGTRFSSRDPPPRRTPSRASPRRMSSRSPALSRTALSRDTLH